MRLPLVYSSSLTLHLLNTIGRMMAFGLLLLLVLLSGILVSVSTRRRPIVPAHFALAVLCITCVQIPLHAEEPKYKPVEVETIAAYKKIGAVYGGFAPLGHGVACFSVGKHLAAERGYMPGFYFDEKLEGKLPKLPEVVVPFGLVFVSTKLSEADLKELKVLKNLTCLYLSQTNITGPGLNELKDLKNLTTICIGDTPLTDEDLKELKGFKNLNHLFLSDTRVTNSGVKQLQESLPNCKISHN